MSSWKIMVWKCIFFCWLFVYMPSSLGPGSALGEKEEKNCRGRKKKNLVSCVSGEVVWGGERPLGHCLAQRYFTYLTPFCAFLPDCKAWFQATCQVKMIGKGLDKIMVILAGHCLLTCHYFEPWTSQVIIWKAHLPERCKNNKFNAEKFSKWLYWFEFLMSSLVKQHQTIHCPLKPK